jgi:hypothetical protein
MMISTAVVRRSAALLLGAAAFATMVTPMGAAQAAPTGLGAGGEYFPLKPDRLVDIDSVDANGEIDVTVVGVKGVPATDVLAVAVNVTVARATGPGYVTVRPSDYDATTGEPTSLINFRGAGDTVPNFTIVGVGSEGKITVDVTSDNPGNVRVIVDVVGWVAKSAYAGADAANGARMKTVTPGRILDTRNSAPIGANQSIKVPVRGAAAVTGGAALVPNDASVTAVVLNVTGINGTANTYLSASPDAFVPSAATPEAPTSTGNYAAGTTKANLAIVPINADGSISIFNRNGSINVAADVVGYLQTGDADDTRTGRIVPLESPFRSFDTRAAEFNSTKLGFSSWEDWSFKDFAGSVTLNGVEVGAQAGLFGNLTAAGLERINAGVPARSFLTLNPTVQAGFSDAPGNSNLNFVEGGAVANTAIVSYGTNGAGDDNMVSAYNADGRTHYILDVYAVILN